jgi:hypothetical protein
MFYQIDKINKHLYCCHCNRKLNDAITLPITLPCGETICSDCVDKLGLKANKSQDSLDEYKCPACSDKHMRSKEGFRYNRVLCELLHESPDEVYRGETFNNLKECLDGIESYTNDLKFSFENTLTRLKQHCDLIRKEVDDAVNIEVENLNNARECLVSQLDIYEQECERQQKQGEEFKKQFLQLMKNSSEFQAELKENWLNKPIVSGGCEEILCNKLNEARRMLIKLKRERIEIENYTFNKKMLFFKESDTIKYDRTCERQILDNLTITFNRLGTIVYVNESFPKFEKWHRIDLNEKLNLNNVDVIHLECFENGNFFCCHMFKTYHVNHIYQINKIKLIVMNNNGKNGFYFFFIFILHLLNYLLFCKYINI